MNTSLRFGAKTHKIGTTTDEWYALKKASSSKVTKVENPEKPKRKRSKKTPQPEADEMHVDEGKEEKHDKPTRTWAKKNPPEVKPGLPSFFYEEGLRLLFKMCRESEAQELRTGREMKRISFLPEAEARMKYVQLTTQVLHWIYNYSRTENERAVKNNDHELVWNRFFRRSRIDRLKITKGKSDLYREFQMEPPVKFANTIFTDGVGVSVLFHVKKPVRAEPLERQSSDIKPPLTHLPPGLFMADDILKQYQGFDEKNIPFVSADPGIMTPVQWYDASNDSYSRALGHLEYHHHTNNAFTRDASHQLNDAMSKIKKDLDAAPYERSTFDDRFRQYLAVKAKHWKAIWFQHINPKYRYARFERYKRGQRFMDKWLQQTKTFAQGKIILFGNGAHKAGGFMSVRGGKAKGPVKRFRKLLAQRHPVISCCEFRSSKCCFHCGGILNHPKGRRLKKEYRPKSSFIFHPKSNKKKSSPASRLPRSNDHYESYRLNGISFCSEPDHPMFLSRDPDASRKIAYLFLYQLKYSQEPDLVSRLGVWSRQVKVSQLSAAKLRSKFLSQFYLSLHPARALQQRGGNELEL